MKHKATLGLYKHGRASALPEEQFNCILYGSDGNYYSARLFYEERPAPTGEEYKISLSFLVPHDPLPCRYFMVIENGTIGEVVIHANR